ncbi:5'-3' exoribonuclease 1, partial [Lepidopterella palustris CBS 459.81]
MGVPKFFRWMSERYPAISQLIAENRIPEFDCLYLDMNGIIHNCTHNDSDSATFRMTEDKMFIAIFNYIEHLFGKIKPKQLFFMAIDGVAPRAKMNQQRARRFRTALDAENAREKAIREGVEMPKEDAFDSNCITPGTEFMAKLTQQLKYFINKKVSEDIDWQGVEVVLSGHEVPGEGEHKIMEYIRQAKSQPHYDPNKRHCLYGLDADLIMLGLLSHDPHFCLLREEVTFGRQNHKKSKELEHQNFYLMHLCIVREYLELEFQELEEPGALEFPFDMERVIDDFILMAFFVGNDFLPNLPHLHINEGALALMFGVYKSVLPKAKGYINEGGVINLKRLELLLDELSHVEYRFFESENADASWFKGKQLGREDVMERTKKKGQLVLSSEQKEIFKKIKKFVNKRLATSHANPCDLPTTLPARDRKFVEDLADSLHLQWKTVENDQGERHLQLSFPPRLGVQEDDDEEESEDAESQNALLRVLQRYENAKVVDMSPEEAQTAMEKKYEEKFQAWKNQHYASKFEWGLDNEEELRKLTENYVQGLQWVLYYYYRGVASWPWFYGYHYAPMISDVKKGLKADMNFKLGQPFRPYQQLMGVLPDRSKKIVPTPYHDLMTNPDSPIIDFYPRDFELDMNGKKMEWEAVVKIPFIEEKRLLRAMATKEHLLTEAEIARNEFGVSLKFTYQKNLDYIYPSSLPGIFPDLEHCHCIENIFELPTMEGLEVFVGLINGVQLGAAALAGFPSLKVVPFAGQLGFHGVSVFQQESRNESMVVTLLDTDLRGTILKAQEKLGKSIHVGYPFLQEGKVVKVSDELFDYVLPDQGPPQPIPIPHSPHEISQWKKKADRVESIYSKRLGMIIGPVESLVHVEMLKGLKKTEDGATVKEYGQIPGIETDYATQTVVDEVVSVDQRFIERAALPIAEEFPEGSRAFFLGDFAYGRPLEVISHADDKATIWVLTVKGRETEFGRDIAMRAEQTTPYTPSFAVARMLHLNPLVLSKLTSSFSVNSSGLRLNLGLNLKFEAKKLKVLGYSRRGDTGWEYSQKAVQLIQQYMIKFPDFIAGIMKNPKGDIYQDTDFYPEAIARDKMKEIGAWLKSIESKNFEKVPLEAEQLDSDVVQLIEQAADAILEQGQPPEPKKLKGVPRSALLKPSDAEQRVGTQRFTLGDRVVYIQDSGRVPIGQRGTVVGLTRTSRTTLLDIVFDTTFMSGTSLGERCSPFRGSTVPITSVLNLTDKQVISWSTAASANRPAPTSQPLTIRGYGAPTGPSGHGQLVPAAIPPPLRGSFRGAVAGQANGTSRGRGGHGANRNHEQQLPIHNGPPRGRGGFVSRGQSAGFVPRGYAGNGIPQRGKGNLAPNQGGFIVTDITDPTEGVSQTPQFRPKSYTNVPPPSSLDTQRGRGRGGPRGGFRGRGAPRG